MNIVGEKTGCWQKLICCPNQRMPSVRWQREVFYMSVERNLGLVQRDGGGKYCEFYIARQGEEPMEVKHLCC